jgi:hypothetical protein
VVLGLERANPGFLQAAWEEAEEAEAEGAEGAEIFYTELRRPVVGRFGARRSRAILFALAKMLRSNDF